MSIAFTIAVSGLSVASLRLRVAASNIANALSDGPLPGTPNLENFPPAYSASRVNQVDNFGGGTSATATNVLPPTVETYDPTAPYADGRGMVASPNVISPTSWCRCWSPGSATPPTHRSSAATPR